MYKYVLNVPFLPSGLVSEASFATILRYSMLLLVVNVCLLHISIVFYYSEKYGILLSEEKKLGRMREERLVEKTITVVIGVGVVCVSTTNHY